MKRISVLFISLFILSSYSSSQEADSIVAGGVVGIGIEISGPIIYAFDSSVLNLEGYISYRLNQKYYVIVEPGIATYSYSQYNYDYNSGGFFIRAGFDMNLLKPKVKPGNHFAGLGVRYGISLFNQETPWAASSNYWGSYDFSIEKRFVHAHFIEISGGVKAEIFRNILIGWSARARLLLYQSAGKTNKPVYIPGMGETGRGLRPSFSYHIIWLIPLNKGR